jgi:endo-1,4-beta-xylanase
MSLTRRRLLAAAASAPIAACQPAARSPPAEPAAIPNLRAIAPAPVGTCIQTTHIQDPAFVALLRAQFSQVTPEWEMKMERIVREDGSFDFSAADAIAGFARDNNLRLYGTTLIWYAQRPAAFEHLDENRRSFGDAYRNYILAVAGRYRGQAVGWDVVNEPVNEEGSGLRESLWASRLGAEDYMVRAFDHAHEADPETMLFINDYNLESRPTKRATFMRLVERLLRRGAKIGGIGNQSHIDIDLPSGAAATAIRDLASFGLPLHISELDISLGRNPLDLRARPERLRIQARKAAEVAEAFATLPAAQRFAFTVWGLRDRDSWLRSPPNDGDGHDAPLLFDDAGRPKPAFGAVAGVFERLHQS